ncbi:MAG: hypothetical protein HN749_06425, partial [Nitrospina sp.]|nr:hypothetical protein [Nitrospina sp.]MBT7708175.1 hypothetical protein [Nitrospina sp.]
MSILNVTLQTSYKRMVNQMTVNNPLKNNVLSECKNMSIIGTIVDVICSIHSGKELQKETCFIGRATTGIKERSVSRGGLEFADH